MSSVLEETSLLREIGVCYRLVLNPVRAPWEETSLLREIGVCYDFEKDPEWQKGGDLPPPGDRKVLTTDRRACRGGFLFSIF